MSPLEKYTWASLLATLTFLSYYGLLVFQAPSGMVQQAGAMTRIYVLVIILFTLVQGLLSTLLLWYTKARHIKQDERERLIETKAYRNAYFFLFGAVNLLLLYILFSDAVGGDRALRTNLYLTFHSLFVMAFVAHLTYLSTQLFYYRRGI